MFRIVMLPANQGDCIWLEYGDEDAPYRVMIDGGAIPTADEIASRLPDSPVHFELVAVTHVDADHIGGMLKFLVTLPEHVTIGDFWFNGWKHLSCDLLGAAQAEMVSAVIEKRKIPWNHAFKGKAACVRDKGRLPTFELTGGMKITLLSPSQPDLSALCSEWERDVKDAGIAPGSTEDALALLKKRMKVPDDLLGAGQGAPDPKKDAKSVFVADTGKANGSSIVLLAEYDHKRVLFCGDAHASKVKRGIQRLLGDSKLELDAHKLSHHGSSKSTDRELIEMLSCSHYLVSTNSAYYNHPDNEALSRVLIYGRKSPKPTLYFNYSTSRTVKWDEKSLRDKYGYNAVYPATGESGLTVTL